MIILGLLITTANESEKGERTKMSYRWCQASAVQSAACRKSIKTTLTRNYVLKQESRAAARKPRDAASVLFG